MVVDYFTNWPVPWWYLASAVVVLGLVLALMRPSRTVLLAASDQGQLQISRHALNRLFEGCCEQLKGVARARATIRQRGGKFHTELRLKLRPNANFEAIRGYLLEEIANLYRENLGLKNVGRIDIRVVGIVPEEEFTT